MLSVYTTYIILCIFVFFIHIVDMDLSLNESETNMMVTEEKIVSVTSLPALLKPGNIL